MRNPFGVFLSIVLFMVALVYLLETVPPSRLNYTFSYPAYHSYEYWPGYYTNYVYTDYVYQPYYNWKTYVRDNYYTTYSTYLPEYVTQTVDEYWY